MVDNLTLLTMLLKELVLVSSLFTPGYLLLSKITGKLFNINLSRGEQIACSFAISLFLLANLSFATGLIGIAILDFFNSYFLASSILTGIFILIKRDHILRALSFLIARRQYSFRFDYFYIFPFLFISIPLFHLFAFAKLNWDGFNFYLRDALAMGISNSIPNYYPESFYPGNITLVFNSYLSSSLYLYSLESFKLLGLTNGNVQLLMQSTTSLLSFIPLATLMTTFILMGSFASSVFRNDRLVMSTLIIFAMMPLLNQFLYIWSLYADLFFAFETLLVLVFTYRFLNATNVKDRYFFLFMIILGLSLAAITKTYGYILFAAVPMLFLSKTTLFQSNLRILSLKKLLLFSLLIISVIAISSLHVIRDFNLTGSPFKLTVESLVNYSPQEQWANEIFKSTIIGIPIENYPLQNQVTSLFFSYGLYPLLMFPLVIGVILSITKDRVRLGIFALYVVFYFIMFLTILEMRIDRHIFSILVLLPFIYVYGLKKIIDFLGWRDSSVLILTSLVIILQIPMFDAIYGHGEVIGFFPTFYYWYDNDNLSNLVNYSLLGLGIAVLLTDKIHHVVRSMSRHEQERTRRKIELMVLGSVFSVTILVLIASQVVTISSKYENYTDFIDRTYTGYHNMYLSALQKVVDMDHNKNDTLIYLHGWGTEYLTMGKFTYIRIDDPRMFATLKDVIMEKDPEKVREILLQKNIRYILYPSEQNSHYRLLQSLSDATDGSVILSDPSMVASKTIKLNKFWNLYVV